MPDSGGEDLWDDPTVDQRLKYFTYYPKRGYPEASLSVFAIVGTILVVLGVRTRAQRWVHILSGTAYAEMLGYIFRSVCVTDTTFAMYVVMTLFLLLPPNALALFNYKTVGEIIRQNNISNERVRSRNKSGWRFWLRPRFVSWFYFSSDLFSIAMQGAGGGMLTSWDTRDAGNSIVLVGLSVQLFFFACFTVTAVYVWRSPDYVVYQGPRDRSPAAAKRKVMICILVTTVLLYLRSIYRIAEFADGYGGKIYSSEWAFYVFDTIIVFLAFLVYIFMYVGPNFPQNRERERRLELATESKPEENADSSAQLVDGRHAHPAARAEDEAGRGGYHY
ncbi:hypothetical protein H4217_003473 [Coemansia sp. RSA 1939]|nr:hypothetical protein LPJ72_002373 [Coemansia sp. Benny D160-2]KAJ2518211.1 hypothetical protein H4217_003473 [Coemansia sp. RSA 1939]KAJ2612058.1 hypothetical protein EV177_003177 [Coemansia sp. RSA 1804]KAJ2694451.1 hypothetical protein GGH99_000673 [Coemansia sp. RSA 1285]